LSRRRKKGNDERERKMSGKSESRKKGALVVAVVMDNSKIMDEVDRAEGSGRAGGGEARGAGNGSSTEATWRQCHDHNQSFSRCSYSEVFFREGLRFG
jgi:hypothetical protein